MPREKPRAPFVFRFRRCNTLSYCPTSNHAAASAAAPTAGRILLRRGRILQLERRIQFFHGREATARPRLQAATTTNNTGRCKLIVGRLVRVHRRSGACSVRPRADERLGILLHECHHGQ